jgi:hypothetical protein
MLNQLGIWITPEKRVGVRQPVWPHGRRVGLVLAVAPKNVLRGSVAPLPRSRSRNQPCPHPARIS